MRGPARRRLQATLLVALVGPAGPAAAGAEETIRVEGETERAPEDLTGFVTIIRAEEFESRVTSLTELLQEAVGLHVRSYGGLGAFATVSIRGSTAEQVNIYVDGVLLNPALGGGVNLADFSLADIEWIEVYRGFTPSYLASGAIGGAINIRTKRPPAGGRSVSGGLSYGSYETAEAALLAAWSRSAPRQHGGLLSAGATGSEGDFRFFDNNGTQQDGSDDGFDTRRNNSFWRADLLGRWEAGLEGGARLDLEGTFTRRRQGVPGIDAFQSLTARSEMTRGLVRAGVAKDRFLADGLRLDLDAYYSRTWQEFRDRLGDTTGGAPADSLNVMDAAGPEALLRWHPRTARVGHYASLLASLRRETAERTDRPNPVPDRGRATRLWYSVSAEDEIHFAGGRFIVSPSARWERLSSRFEAEPGVPDIPAARRDEAQLTGRIGAAWRPRPGLTFRAGAGRFHRAPSFTEIFGDQGTVRGSESLEAERGRNYDMGVTWEARRERGAGRLFLEAVLFRRDADNLIQFLQTSQSQVTAENVGRARVTGAELSVGLGLAGWLGGDLNYTWQAAEDRSDSRVLRGTDLPGRPRHEAAARASATRPWGRPFYEFSYTGPSFIDRAASVIGGGSAAGRDQVRIPGRYLHSVGFTRPAGRRLELTVEVDNVFNVKTVDVARYPLPGRLAQVKLRLRTP